MASNATTEVWKLIKGFEQLYEVSNLGRVRRSTDDRRNRNKAGYILKPAVAPTGYLFVRLFDGKSYTNKYVHRLVAIAFVLSETKIMKEVNHLDAVKANNYHTNLEWTTRAGNVNHAKDLGLMNYAHGDRHYRSKLRAMDIPNIRALAASGVSYNEIGRRTGVSPATIRVVALGITWKHVK